LRALPTSQHHYRILHRHRGTYDGRLLRTTLHTYSIAPSSRYLPPRAAIILYAISTPTSVLLAGWRLCKHHTTSYRYHTSYHYHTATTTHYTATAIITPFITTAIHTGVWSSLLSFSFLSSFHRLGGCCFWRWVGFLGFCATFWSFAVGILRVSLTVLLCNWFSGRWVC
jgi:hypothetical protein